MTSVTVGEKFFLFCRTFIAMTIYIIILLLDSRL
jgi:hypothetical protein